MERLTRRLSRDKAALDEAVARFKGAVVDCSSDDNAPSPSLLRLQPFQWPSCQRSSLLTLSVDELELVLQFVEQDRDGRIALASTARTCTQMYDMLAPRMQTLLDEAVARLSRSVHMPPDVYRKKTHLYLGKYETPLELRLIGQLLQAPCPVLKVLECTWDARLGLGRSPGNARGASISGLIGVAVLRGAFSALGMLRLRSVGIGDNGVQRLFSGSLGSLENLELLDLSANSLSAPSLETIGEAIYAGMLLKLHCLFLSENHFGDESLSTFLNYPLLRLPSLKRLSLRSTGLLAETVVALAMRGYGRTELVLPNLEYLDIRDNAFYRPSTIHDIPRMLTSRSTLPRLKTLRVGYSSEEEGQYWAGGRDDTTMRPFCIDSFTWTLVHAAANLNLIGKRARLNPSVPRWSSASAVYDPESYYTGNFALGL